VNTTAEKRPSTLQAGLQPWRLFQITLILLSGAAVYAKTLHVPYVLDDYWAVTPYGEKSLIKILLHGGPRRVADATFALNYNLHGLEEAGYHLVNIAIHLAAAITLYFVTVSALAALRGSYPANAASTPKNLRIERFVPLAAALLFALHPLQTQAVTYLIQRYTSLATLFYLLSALAFIRARLVRERGGSFSCNLLPGAACLAAGLLAIGSKQIAATLPLIIIFLELSLFRGRLLNRRFFILCAAAAILILATLLVSWQIHSLDGFLQALDNATTEHRNLSRVTYLLTETQVVATYLRLLCLPFGQSLLHDGPLSTTIFSPAVIASLTLHISLLATAVILFRTSGINLRNCPTGKGCLQRLAALGIVWFYVTLAVESSIFPITDVIFEHRVYLPSAGFFLTIAATAALVLDIDGSGLKRAWLLLALVSITLGGLTIARNRIWGDSLTLWQDTVKKAPGKDLARANLAGEYMKLNMPDKALPHFVRALELNPDFHPQTKVYLGLTLQRLNVDGARFTTGEELLHLERSGKGEVKQEDTGRLEAVLHNNLGLSYEIMGQPGKARESYQAALLANPEYDLAWYNFGLMSVRSGDKKQVNKALSRLKSLNPGLAASLAEGMIR
jgi:tetratricopeptide (TPR) repeat protein